MGTAPDRDYYGKPRDAVNFLGVAADIFKAVVLAALTYGAVVAILSLEAVS